MFSSYGRRLRKYLTVTFVSFYPLRMLHCHKVVIKCYYENIFGHDKIFDYLVVFAT